jgi:hypothetical protein
VETKKAGNPYNTVDLRRIGLWVGALVLVIDSISLIVIGEFLLVITGGMFVGLAAISMNLWPYIGMQQPTKDERAARIGAMAGLASWYVTLIVTVVGAILLGYLLPLWDIHPTLAQGLGGVILVMVLTMVVFYEYMIRKSDAE